MRRASSFDDTANFESCSESSKKASVLLPSEVNTAAGRCKEVS